jgi:hypothetical protein
MKGQREHTSHEVNILMAVIMSIMVFCTMAYAVSHQPVTTEVWVQFQAPYVGFVMDKAALVHVFLQVLQFPTNAVYSLMPYDVSS